MSGKAEVAVIGIDIGNNSLHVVGLSALANKLARIAWSVLAHGHGFEVSAIA